MHTVYIRNQLLETPRKSNNIFLNNDGLTVIYIISCMT